MQDNHDVWCNDMDVAGITNGGIVGFKYFGFGGLEKWNKGVNPFVGTKKGDGTQLDLYLTPGRHGAFKIHVMLDGPYANATWKGREIAVVEVPDGKRGELLHLTVPVPAVEGLSGKHAIFLVAEGADIQRPQMDPRFAAFAARNPRRPDGLFDPRGIPAVPTACSTCTASDSPSPAPPASVRPSRRSRSMPTERNSPFLRLRSGSRMRTASWTSSTIKSMPRSRTVPSCR